MAKNRLEPYEVIADHYDQIHSMNPYFTEDQILSTIAKSTGQSASTVKKRWKLIACVDWPIIDYVERGVIGLTRANLVAEADLSREERTEAMDKSLDENVMDSDFKDWLTKHMNNRSDD